jgi:hypothetical protein
VSVGYRITENGESIFVPMKDFTAVAGTPAIAIHGGGRRNVLAFANAGTETADAWVRIPKGWESVAASVVWINAGSGSGDVVWRVQGLASIAGESINAVDNTGGAGTTTTAGAQDVVVVSPMTGNLTVDENDYLSFRVSRLGGTADDSPDTLGNDAGLIGVLLTRA